ncbi:uncharacterized protein LOC134199641 [Bombyx mori]|uniref:uncharacterized protein LOC134199641 n=1 Tax=Bombyx mori TaxID=7091 RepID=UPI002ED4C8A3
MSDNEDEVTPLESFPTEILSHIFTFLPAKQLTKCREVCIRWKNVIDTLNKYHSLWYKFCGKDFKNVYKFAHRLSRPQITWHELYRSLTLWRQLHLARQHYDEFASATTVASEIQGFRYLRNGTAGVHTKAGVVYYDLDTLQRSKRAVIYGDYNRYVETDDTVLLMNSNLHLFITRKLIRSPKHIASISHDNCKLFYVIDNVVYYVSLNESIYAVYLSDKELKSHFLVQSTEGIICLGHTGKNLNIITLERNIYTLIGHELQLQCTITEESNLLHEFNKYNLFDHFDWRVYIQWMFALCFKLPEGPLRDIVTVRSYGDIFFVGSDWGVLRIYHSPFTNGELDFMNHMPLKQYNFMERSDCPVLSVCPIIEIEVMEIVDGHIIMVAMPKKVAVLTFSHCFKRAASIAMFSNSNLQRVKFLKIEEEVGAI